MKKIFLVLIFSTISNSVFAEWTLIQTNDEGNLYVDFDTLQKYGDTVSVDTLTNFYNRQDKNELSSKWREMYDCKTKRFKALSIEYFAENMGQGSVIESTAFDAATTSWTSLVQYSVGELKSNIICSR